MENDTQASTTAQTNISWLKWISGSTLVASLGYGSFYVTGLVYHQTYLSRFNIPPDLFKGTTAEYFVFAYLAWLESMPSWFNRITGDYRPLALIFLLLFSAIGLSVLLVLISEKPKVKSIQEKIQTSKILYLVGGLLGIPIFIISSLIFLLSALILVAILPAWIGDHGATKTVARDQAKFSSKCAASDSKSRCMDLMEDNKVLATGYVLQASERHIALLAPDGVKIYPLKERALRLHVPDESKKP